MGIITIEKSNKSAKAEEAANKLGISRTIYAVGYSFRDAAIWFVASTVALTGILYGLRETRPVKFILDKFGNHEKSWKTKFSKKFPNLGPIILVSMALGWLSSHFVQIPSSAVGWKKAQAAINKHNALSAEKDQLVEVNTLLAEDNEKLKTALAEAEKKRLPLADRVRAQQSAGIGASNSL